MLPISEQLVKMASKQSSQLFLLVKIERPGSAWTSNPNAIMEPFDNVRNDLLKNNSPFSFTSTCQQERSDSLLSHSHLYRNHQEVQDYPKNSYEDTLVSAVDTLISRFRSLFLDSFLRRLRRQV